MERLVLGVSNCVIHSVIHYLTTQILDGSEINQKIVDTFGETLFVLVITFWPNVRLFSDRFYYHLSLESLNKVWHCEWQLAKPTTGRSMFILMSFIVPQRDLYSAVEISNVKNFYDLAFQHYIVCDLWTSEPYLLIILRTPKAQFKSWLQFPAVNSKKLEAECFTEQNLCWLFNFTPWKVPSKQWRTQRNSGVWAPTDSIFLKLNISK